MDKMQFYASIHIEKRNRSAQFWATATLRDDGQWLVNTHADYVKSNSCLTNDPALLFAALVEEWKAEIS